MINSTRSFLNSIEAVSGKAPPQRSVYVAMPMPRNLPRLSLSFRGLVKLFQSGFSIARSITFSPTPDMDEATLLSCVDWVAHGFEIVQSIFPQWQFSAADTVAANGLHGALLIGPQQTIGLHVSDWQRMLSAFEIDLLCDGRVVDRGHSESVLGGPASALRHLVSLLREDQINPLLAAGEIVTTGTLTRPVKPGPRSSTVSRWTASDCDSTSEIQVEDLRPPAEHKRASFQDDEVRFGSKAEKLTLSICCPLCTR
jgi:hypothetical protein